MRADDDVCCPGSCGCLVRTAGRPGDCPWPFRDFRWHSGRRGERAIRVLLAINLLVLGAIPSIDPEVVSLARSGVVCHDGRVTQRLARPHSGAIAEAVIHGGGLDQVSSADRSHSRPRLAHDQRRVRDAALAVAGRLVGRRPPVVHARLTRINGVLNRNLLSLLSTEHVPQPPGQRAPPWSPQLRRSCGRS